MKRLITLFFFLAFAVSLASARPDTLSTDRLKALLRDNPALAGGNHLVASFGSDAHAPAPKGYKPVYISHYGRHGARYITSAKKYDLIWDLLDNGYRKNALTAAGEDLYRRYAALYPLLKGHNGDLTVKGQEQHRDIAARMVGTYPSVFGKKVRVDARSTIVPRAIISMMSFCDQLREMRPGMRLTYAADFTDMPVTALAASSGRDIDEFKKIYANEALGAALYKASADIGLDPEAFFLRYFKSMAEVEACGKPDELMTALGEVAYNLQCLETDEWMDDIFTEEERFKLWQRDNLWAALMFVDSPYCKGIISARACSLLKDIMDLADEDISSGSVQVRLRFGHDTVVAPLMDILGIEGWTPLGADMTLWKHHFQSWNIPMASNVQMIFYKGKKGDILVRVMYNEKDQILPLKDQSLAPYYSWEAFKEYYEPKCREAQTIVEGFFDDNPVLEIEGGRIQGVKENGALVYKGVPFAAPPVGELRGKPLQPVIPWEGIRKADTFPLAATQPKMSPDDPLYYREFYTEGSAESGEDCMYLNIWTPQDAVGKPESKLPVAVWIHGGAFLHGWSFEVSMDGAEWAKRGVILVTIPYRLGELGFGTDEMLGFKDQIKALQWVRDNISAFGGDPSNVTIFGGSAGAISCKYLLTMPEADDLFAKAILQSGGGINVITAVPHMPARPRGQTLEKAMEEGCFDRKPIMTGWVGNDPGFLGKETVLEFCDMKATRGGSPVYVFDFERDLPGEKEGEINWGAFHGCETWYIFGTLGRAWRPFTEADYDLSRRMIDAWTAFCRTGNPGWDAYTPNNKAVHIFDVE